MMKTLKSLTTIVAICIMGLAAAQETGSIKGTITDDKGENMPFVSVALLEDSIIVQGLTTDVNGDFSFKHLVPGIYSIRLSFLGYKERRIKNIEVSPDKISYVYKAMKPISTDIDVVVVESEVWEKPIINSTYSTMTNITIDKIETVACQKNDVIALITTFSPAVMATPDGKDVYMRGTRSGSTGYYVDGNKMIGSMSVPGLGVSGVEVLAGGVPAEYGDCTGGLVIITTKDYNTEIRRKRIKQAAQKEHENKKVVVSSDDYDE